MALTLPEGVIRGLCEVDPDLAWAIVTLVKRRKPSAARRPREDAELVGIADRHSLIVVRRQALTRVPGVRVVPLDRERAFLALESGQGIADLELAIVDRLGEVQTGSRHAEALSELRTQLRKWRHSRVLRFHSHSIIVVEHVERGNGPKAQPAESPSRSPLASRSSPRSRTRTMVGKRGVGPDGSSG